LSQSKHKAQKQESFYKTECCIALIYLVTFMLAPQDLPTDRVSANALRSAMQELHYRCGLVVPECLPLEYLTVDNACVLIF